MSALTDTFTAIANKIRTLLRVETTYTPSEMPSGIEDVYTAGQNAGIAATKVGTASASDVLSGKTFTNASNVGANGSMTNQGNKSFTVDDTSPITIPAGFYNGNGRILTRNLMQIPTDTMFIDYNGLHDVTDYANARVEIYPLLSANGQVISNDGNQSVSVNCQDCTKMILIYISTYNAAPSSSLSAEGGTLSLLYSSQGLQASDKCGYGVKVYQLEDLDNYLAVTVNISQRTPSASTQIANCVNLIAIKVAV